jgi:ribosome recycling factor
MDDVEQTQSKMKAVIEHLKSELKSLRTGRANPAMIENLLVDVYGTGMRLREIANITTPEARQLLITPYDRTQGPVISKAVERANLGLQPVLEGHMIRITVPPMDANMRKEMIKQAHQKREEAKVGVRHVRRETNDHLKKRKNDGDLAEDVMKSLEKKVQDLTDRNCKEADDLVAAKEKEISTV